MENAGQFMSTQAGEEPMAPDASALPAETEDAAVLAHRKAFKDAKQAQMDKKRRAEDTRLFVLYLEHQGATPEEIKVKLNKRKKSFRRKQAKANMAPLEFGTAFYKHQEEDNGITSISKRTAKRRRLNLPLHPSQVEHRNLACHYVNDIRTMAKKNVLRM